MRPVTNLRMFHMASRKQSLPTPDFKHTCNGDSVAFQPLVAN